MTYLDRCEICGYNTPEGSNYSGADPGQNGKVSPTEYGLVCTACYNEIRATAFEYPDKEEE